MEFPGTSQRPIWITLGVLVLLIAIFQQTALSMATIWWRSETFAHGFLILPISAYMIWTRRGELSGIRLQSSYVPLVLFIPVLLAWLAATLLKIDAGSQFALVAMLPLVTWALLGRRLFLAILFPLMYLFFAVPFGEFLVPVLIDHTAAVTIRAIELTGIPIYADGRMITLPTGSWEVAKACSGIRYLMASVALGSLFAYLNFRSYWKRAGFILLSILIPIAANWLRAFGIVMLGHFSNMTVAVGVDHIIYGWLLFGLIMLLLFWLGSLWRDPEPVIVNRAREPSRLSLPLAALLLLASLATVAVEAALRDGPAQQDTRTIRLPQQVPGWRGPLPDPEHWAPRYEGAADLQSALYERDGRQVRVYLISYAADDQGKGLISSSRRLLDPQDWSVASQAFRAVAAPDGEFVQVRQNTYRSRQASRLVWRWYEIAGQRTGRDWEGKLQAIWSRLTGTFHGSHLVAVAADYDLQLREAETPIAAFVHDSGILAAQERDGP